ncbi:protein mono-ADP-ribosyltransferase PARP10 isoform X2 [Marmota marmota marmota]|uniref:protein mono-ADP-ribosyltransferase PARP10 isoform X2 n=1 Tax=Marmota marmota marmota TaxID=9994 RepID=UPI0007629CD7|nr:protein mono-ADP-ribosyltransferase PARP10 isoform X2 [Marmota marmota marmota]
MAEVEEGAAVELQGLPPDMPEELLMLYFENRRRSGGGPVLSWQRLGCGGILTFREPADAKRVLAQAEHRLHGARLSLHPAPPRAPARLLLQGLPPGTVPLRLEQHVQALLSAMGHPVQSCHALASPRPDRALVQLAMPLSEAEIHVLEEQARNTDLDGAMVSVTWVPQARAVRVVRGTPPLDMLLLELYLENERRSGGGPLEGLRSLPRQLGTVVSFQQWQVAERVLQQDHWLQGSELKLVPHYDILEPEELAEGTKGKDNPSMLGSEHALLETRGLAETLKCAGAVTVGSGEAPGQLEAFLRTGLQAVPVGLDPVGCPEQEGPMGSLEQEGPVSLGTVGSPEQAGLMGLGPMGSAGSVGPVEVSMELLGQVKLKGQRPMGLLAQESLMEVARGSPGQEGLVGPEEIALESAEKVGVKSPGHMGLQGQEGLVEMVLSMEPGAMRFLQLYHEDLLASLGDVALFPLEGMEVTGFRVDSTEILQVLPGHSHTWWPTDSTGSDQENMSLEEVRELLATMEGFDRENWLSLELGEEGPEDQPEEAATSGKEDEEPTPGAREKPVSLSTGAAGQLEEEAALQLALHRSLEPQDKVAEQEEAAALRQALALSLLEQPLLEAEESLNGGTGSGAQLVVHAPFEQDIDELEQALTAALEVHLNKETVRHPGRVLPTELCARLGQCHGVNVALRGDCTVFCGFGAQPARAARHFAVLLAGPWDQSLAFPLVASDTTLLEQRLKRPLGKLEGLEESTKEFQNVVKAFYDTLDTAHSRIRIIRVERVSHPLLQQQYQLHLERLEERCVQRPVERVLYHGTSASAVPDICAFGFNRSFCGRNGTLYGQGVYFATRASLSVQDRYSPPNADGHKAVFVARVLTGDYAQGRRDLRAPPLRPSGHVLLRYDSAVDCLHQPSIFVIFHDTQALPTHLITCEHIPRASLGLSSPSLAT